MIKKAKLIVAELFHKLNYIKGSESSSASIEKKILNGLKKKGFFSIESFLTPEDCKTLREKTDVFLSENKDKVKFESNGNDLRVYGINLHDNSFVIPKVEAISERIFNDFSFILEKNYFYLLGKIEAGMHNLGSGSGWHRDSPISNQFKTILYLSDVSENNGPFQYLPNSHRYSSILKTSNFLNKSLSERRFSDDEIQSLIKNKIVEEPKTFKAKQGTLMFVNTRGLHRGAPLKEENRYALTRYHFAKKNKKFE